MKRIKFTTERDDEDAGERITKLAMVIFEKQSSAKDGVPCTEKDIRRKIAESAADLWGKMGSLKVVINEIKAREGEDAFDITFPKSQLSRVGFLLFFITEINGKKARVKFVARDMNSAK